MSTLHGVPEAPAGDSRGKRRTVTRSGSTAPSSGGKRGTTRKRPNAPSPDQPASERPHLPDQDTIEHMVAEAAYYLAERRSFAPGYEEEDWLAAKEQIAAQFRDALNPLNEDERPG
jgi:hypothetical protein